ncbi:hypothetical protein Tco_0652321 [Tanacetum coccineum]|uniref:NAC domain-containing protein n=1 Tax=Tanacetum coccineum TaxID=301880 RepID=A0ABQ4WX91_9ASTR
MIVDTSDSLLEEFADELALLDPFPPGNEDNNFDPEQTDQKYLLDRDSTLHEELPEIDTLPLFPSRNEDKVLNPGILVHGRTYIVIPPPASKQFSLREVERFVYFFLPNTVGWEDEGGGDHFF